MNNNMNNNVNPNVNGISTTGVNTNANVSNVNVIPAVASTGGSTVNNTQVVTPSTNVVSNSIPVTNTVVNNQNDINNQDGVASNTYVVVGGIVGVVLLASVGLLVLLVTGVIGSRNRMTCTKTINENGYVYAETRYYKFDKGLYSSVDKVITYTYNDLTDDMYNQQFDRLINNNSGVSSYGFGTQISREGNVVTITAYEPRYFDQTKDDIEIMNSKEGFTCD